MGRLLANPSVATERFAAHRTDGECNGDFSPTTVSISSAVVWRVGNLKLPRHAPLPVRLQVLSVDSPQNSSGWDLQFVPHYLTHYAAVATGTWHLRHDEDGGRIHHPIDSAHVVVAGASLDAFAFLLIEIYSPAWRKQLHHVLLSYLRYSQGLKLLAIYYKHIHPKTP